MINMPYPVNIVIKKSILNNCNPFYCNIIFSSVLVVSYKLCLTITKQSTTVILVTLRFLDVLLSFFSVWFNMRIWLYSKHSGLFASIWHACWQSNCWTDFRFVREEATIFCRNSNCCSIQFHRFYVCKLADVRNCKIFHRSWCWFVSQHPALYIIRVYPCKLATMDNWFPIMAFTSMCIGSCRLADKRLAIYSTVLLYSRSSFPVHVVVS